MNLNPHFRSLSGAHATTVLLLFGMLALLIPSDLHAATTHHSGTSGNKPTLPPAHFPPGSGLVRRSSSEKLAEGVTLLGRTELVAFSTTLGLCVETDHIPQRSRAGGCDINPLSANQLAATVALGYSGAPGGRNGVTEILGQAKSVVNHIRVVFFTDGHRHRAPVLFSQIRGQLADVLHVQPIAFFAINLPTCVEGDSVRFQVFREGGHVVTIKPQFHQQAACAAGSGFSVSGSTTFGSLPPVP